MPAFAFIPGDTIQWVAVLIDAAAKGLVVLLLAGGAALLLRRSSAAVRHMTWTLSIAALILVPFLSLALPQLQVPLLPYWAGVRGLARVEQTAAQPPAVVELPVGTGGPGAESVMSAGDWPLPAGAPQPVHLAHAAPEAPAAPVLAAAAPQTPPVHWSAWVLLAWLAGAAALLLPLLAGTIIVWRQARRAERINSGSWVHLLDELRPRLGVRGRVVLLRSNWPNIPLTCGIFRPAIILPAEADNWPADRRKVVLLHELAHIRRRDCLTQLLARLARVIYWFNPLVWLAGRMLRIEREQACDDLVLASGHKASDYAGHLLEIVRSLHSVRCPSLAAVAMARKSQFEGRLLAILDPRRNRRSLTRWGLLIAVLLAVSVAIPLAILRAAESSKPDIQQNISQLQSNDEGVWKPAVGKLIAIGPSVAEPLAELFAKGGPSDAHAMQVLEGMATNPEVQALMRKGLDSKNPNVVHCSMLILGKSGNQEHAKTIAALLEKNTIAACIALSELGGEEAFQALVAALNKPNIEPRWMVVEHLARLGKPGAIPGIKEALTHLTGEELATAKRYVAAIHKLEGDGSRPGLTSFSSFHATGDRNWRVLQGINLDKMDMVYIEPFKPEATPEGTRIKAYQALRAKEGLDLAWDQSEGNRLLAVNGVKLAPYAPALPNGYDVWSDGERLLDQKQLVRIVEQYSASGKIPEVGERVRAYPFKNGDYFLALLPDGRVAIIRTADVWTKDEHVCVRLAAKVLDPLYQLIPATTFAAKAATQPARDFAFAVAEEFSSALRGQSLPWLDDSKLKALGDTIERLVLKHQPADMPDELRLSILAAIKGYVGDRFRTPGTDTYARETAYCAFPDHVKTFQWELWLAMRRQPLAEAGGASREVQRKWLRSHVQSLPEALPNGTHEAALASLDAALGDPFSPLFYQPMSDAQFEQVKKALGNYTTKEEIRFVVSHIVWQVLKAWYTNASDVALPFDDDLTGYGAGGVRVELSFKSNASFKGRQLSLQAGEFLDVSGPAIRSGGELPLLTPSLRRDVVMDAELQSLTAVRGSKLILLHGSDWLEIDSISDNALMTPSQWKETSSIALDKLKGIGVIELSKFPGRFLAVRTAEGRLSVIEVLSVDGKSVILHVRPRGATQPAAPALQSDPPNLRGLVLSARKRYKLGQPMELRLKGQSLNWAALTGDRGDGNAPPDMCVDAQEAGGWKYWFIRVNGKEYRFKGTGTNPGNGWTAPIFLDVVGGPEWSPGKYRVQYLARDLPVRMLKGPQDVFRASLIASNEVEFEVVPPSPDPMDSSFAFGEAREETLSPQRPMLNLASGKIITSKPHFKSPTADQDELGWYAANGVDVEFRGDRTIGGQRTILAAMMQARLEDKSFWDSAAPSAIRDALELEEPAGRNLLSYIEPRMEPRVPSTWAIKTHAGQLGLLQLLSLDANSDTLKLRWKLLAETAPAAGPRSGAQPATQPAQEKPGAESALGPAIERDAAAVEGAFAVDKPIETELTTYSAGKPDLMQCKRIRFEKAEESGHLGASVWSERGGCRQSPCALRVELFDAAGKSLGYTEQVFGAQSGGPSDASGITEELYLSLGTVARFANASRFRLSLRPVSVPALGALEGILELDHYFAGRIVYEVNVRHGEESSFPLSLPIAFETDPNGIVLAKVDVKWPPVQDATYRVCVELLDSAGQVVKTALAPFSTRNDPKWRSISGSTVHGPNRDSLRLNLGPRKDLAGAVRFRVSLLADEKKADAAAPATQPVARIGVAELEKRKIEGKVVDADGKLVADAEVLMLKPGPHYLGLEYAFEQEIVARTRSDADGRFFVVVTGIPEEVYLEAIARKPGVGFGYNQCIGLPAWDGRMREVRLHKTGLLEGLVVDESGQPVADAQVRADVFEDEDAFDPDVLGCPNLDWFVTRTGKDGRFVLSGVPADMRAEFIVRAAGHGTVATQVPNQAPRFRTGQKDIRIVLPSQCRIEGVVIDKSTGKPVADVQLIAFGGHVSDNSTGEPPLSIGFITPPGLAKADKDGRFVMEALEPGRWTVALAQQRMIECTEPAQWVAQTVVVDLAAGKSQSIRVELSRGETVEVALVDAATGAPVRGRLYTFAQKKAMEMWSAMVSDDKGIVRLRLLPGRYTLFASDYPNHVVIPGQEAPRPFRGRMDLTVEHGKPQHVQIRLVQEPATQPAAMAPASKAEPMTSPTPFTCSGVVVDDRGMPVASAEVIAMRFFWGDERLGTHYAQIGQAVTTGNDGRFKFATRAPLSESPSMVVFARKAGLALGWSRWPYTKADSEVAVKLSPGSDPQGRPNALRGAVVDEDGKPVAGASVAAFLRKDSCDVIGLPAMKWLDTRTDPNGRFELAAVPPEAQAEFLVSAPGLALLFTGSNPKPYGFGQYSTSTDARIVLPKAGRIEARVVDKLTGKGIAGLSFKAVMIGSMWGLENARAVSGPDGELGFSGLRPGTWTLQEVCGPTDRPACVCPSAGAEVEAGKTTRDVKVEATTGADLDVSLVDPNGLPVANALFFVSNAEMNWARGCQTDPNGNARVRVMPGLVKAEWAMAMVAHPYMLAAKETVTIAPGQTRTVRMQARLEPIPGGPATQPAGSKLEFRIAPSASSLTNAERDSYMDWLKAGKVGFWWKGGRIRGRMPDHAWLAFADDMATAGNLVTGEYQGQKCVLVSDKPGQTMVPGEGKDAWGLAKVYPTKDPLNQPAVGFEMDDRGAELFTAFTKANIGNVVAIVVDGKVSSVPVIRAAIGKQGTIPGRFSEQEVQALVKALKAGMPTATTAPAATQPGGEDQVFLPAGSLDVRRERLLWKEGVTPAVQVDIRNSGMERFFITRTPDGYEVEVDGRWYHWAPARSEAPKYTRLVKNAGAGDVRLLLDSSWQSKADGTPLHFRTGMHKLRVGAICRRTPDASAESHTIVSGVSQMIIESPTVDDPNDPEGFRRELLLAKEAGAAIEKVRHLHKARQYRPQPDDIELEYGVATYLDNFAGGRGREEREAMWGEARDLLQHIIDTYDHMRYYTTSGPDTPRGPEVLLPSSAVMLGYRSGDPNLCYQAMVWLKQTNDRRVKDWLEAPEPRLDPNNPFTEGVVARSKWQSRVANWRKRKEDAAAGDALNGIESQLAAGAVRGYVQGFGPHEGADALRRIIRDFPRTAMARLAAQQLELATGQTPAIKATGQPSQVDWGAAENGLRCRWVQPKGSFASGTAPEVSAEVENHGPTPVIWQCTMRNIWQLRIAGVWQEDWEQPSFDIQKIKGVRHATAGEVRQALGNRTTSAPDEQACDGYYRVESGGRLKVTTTLPWKLTSPGAYRLECRFIRSFMSRGGQLTFISCPPLVLHVTNAESPTQPTHSASSRPAPDVPQDVHSANANANLTWGKGPVRIQDGNSAIEGKRITIEDGRMQVEGNAILKANNDAEVKADRVDIRPNAPASQPAPNGASTRPAITGAAAIQDVIRMLGLPWQEKITDEAWDKAAASIRPVADEAVATIMMEFNARRVNAFSFQHRAVQVFERLATPKAKAALIDIALGRTAADLPSLKQWAASSYIRTLTDKTEARVLLPSDDAGVLNVALLAIQGIRMDGTLMEQLEAVLVRKDKEPNMRMTLLRVAGLVMSADPGSEFASHKVDAILAAAGRTPDMPDTGELPVILSGTRLTFAEIHQANCLNCLSRMKNADAPLREAVGRTTGLSRDIACIALAMRGDASMRPEMIRILQESSAGFLRRWAAEALGVVGTNQDAALLKRLAESDPLEREEVSDVGPRSRNVYPVRESARQAAERLTKKPPVTQPVGSKLEFRIAPSASSLTNAERDSYMDWLKAGKVGFWWKGGRIAGRMPDHAWLGFAGDMANAGNLVTGEYKGQMYVLVSDKPGQTRLPGEGKEAWGLTQVYATTDGMNHPTVGFELDDSASSNAADTAILL